MPLKKSKVYFSHYRALIGLSVLGLCFFGYLHRFTYTSLPSTEKDFDNSSVAVLKTLDWLGVFISFCVGVIAHWLHRRLDRHDSEPSNEQEKES